MPTVFYSQEEFETQQRELHRLRQSVRDLEAMRPHWAEGHTSDSVAAQCAYTALNQLRDMLGAINQSQAVEAIRKLQGHNHG